MRATLVAVLIGATLGLLVAGVLVFAVWDACELDNYGRALVLSCIGYDGVRIWPLPVMQPWFEDPGLLGTPEQTALVF